MTRRAENLGAVDHPVVTVASRSGRHRRRVGAASGLGNRHRTPFGLAFRKSFEEPRLLFRSARSHDRGATQSAVWYRKKESGIAPAQLLRGDDGVEIAQP